MDKVRKIADKIVKSAIPTTVDDFHSQLIDLNKNLYYVADLKFSRTDATHAGWQEFRVVGKQHDFEKLFKNKNIHVIELKLDYVTSKDISAPGSRQFWESIK